MLPSSGLNGGSIVQVTACRLPFTAKTSAGTLWQVDGRKVLPDEVSHLERFRGNSVAGGRLERLLGTLSWEFRARWEAGKATWNAFAGKPWQVGSREMPPETLSREFRARWDGGKGHLTRFREVSVPGGDTSVHVGRDILWLSAGPSRNAGPFPSREPMPASASVCPCHPA